MKTTALKILIVEDTESDAVIIQRLLIRAGSQYEFEVVFERAAYIKALQNFKPDVVLSDNAMPQFSAAEALQILQQQKTLIPFILVTGTVSEEFAAGIIKAGADDYLLKDRLTRLPVAIEAAVKQKKADREKLEAIEQLKQSEEKYREIVENITDIIFTHDLDGKILSTNLAAKQNLGYEISELEGMNIKDLLSPSYKDKFSDYINLIEQDGYVNGFMHVQTKAGKKRIWEYKNTLSYSGNGIKLIRGFAQDVTERLEAERMLSQSEKRFRALVENNEGIISMLDKNRKTIFRSASAARITGWSNEEFENIDTYEYVHPDDLKKAIETFALALDNPGIAFPHLLRVKHKDGHYIWLEGVINNLLHEKAIGGIISNLRNVTKRKNAEIKLIKANRLYALISQVNQMIVRISDHETIFKEVCKIAIDFGKFKMAWIGITDIETNTVTAVVHAGEESGYLNQIKVISTRDIPEGRGPTGSAVRTGKFTVCNDIENDPLMAPWKEEAISRGYRSLIALPIKKFGNVIGAFTLYAGERNFFDAEEIALLEEATGDVSFGLELFEKEELRKKAEERILESEQSYHTLAEISPSGIFRTDTRGNTTYVNSRWCKIAGFSAEEAMGTGWQKAVHVDDKKKLLEGWKKALVANEPSMVEYRMLRPDGTGVWVIGQSNPERNLDNQIIGYVGTVMDITERKKVEAAIIESEEKYRVLVAEASEGIFISDSNGRFVTVNASACRLSQYTEDELLQMSIYDFLTHDDIQERPLQFDAVRAGKTVVVERVLKLKDGTLNHLEITSKLLTDGRLLSLVRDISDRKKAEAAILLSNERYNLVSKATNDSIWDLNILTGATNRTGDGFKTLFGYENESANDPEHHWTKLIHPEDLEKVNASQILVFMNPNEYYWEQEYRFLKRDGNYAFVYDKGYIIRDEAGNAIRMIGAMQDISRQKENESHLIKLNESLLAKSIELADSNAELEQFAFVASHDMQEPLRMVTSFLLLLEKKYKSSLDDTGKKYIHFAVDGAKRMRQIILDLLEFSRVGQNYIQPKELDLNELIHEIESLYRKQIEEKNASIGFDKLPVIIASESPIRQVFQNLIGNALKYSKDETPVRIKIEAIDLNDYWQFSVADNGIGISKDYYEKIFVIFQRLHNSEEFSGTGIGLAVTKKIIEKIGGKIWVQSEEGKGSTFYFTLKK